MSSISVRFNSFSFSYSIFNEHKSLLLGTDLRRLVGLDGLEPSTSRLSGVRSSHLSYKPFHHSAAVVRVICLSTPSTGGDDGVRTHDPLLAGQVLSQLSYTPVSGFVPLFKDLNDPQKLNNKSSVRCFLCFRSRHSSTPTDP